MAIHDTIKLLNNDDAVELLSSLSLVQVQESTRILAKRALNEL